MARFGAPHLVVHIGRCGNPEIKLRAGEASSRTKSSSGKEPQVSTAEGIWVILYVTVRRCGVIGKRLKYYNVTISYCEFRFFNLVK